MPENLIDLYYEKLYKEDKPGNTLTSFFCELFEQGRDRKLYMTFNKLLRLYGRDIIFFAITEIYDMENITIDNIYPLLAYVCRRRTQTKFGNTSVANFIDLTSEIKAREKLTEKAKNISLEDIPDPFAEEDNVSDTIE